MTQPKLAPRPGSPPVGLIGKLNGEHHRAAVNVFMLIVIAHWGEHIIQSIQIWGLGWERKESLARRGLWFPWLVSSEVLHYGYAFVMLIGLWVLRHGFVGRARRWWMASFWIQAWHHLEHFLLIGQAVLGATLLGNAAPTSIVQLVVPRVELHLFYNVVVFLPMIVAVYLHLRPNPAERQLMSCSCDPRRALPSMAGAAAR